MKFLIRWLFCSLGILAFMLLITLMAYLGFSFLAWEWLPTELGPDWQYGTRILMLGCFAGGFMMSLSMYEDD